MKTKLLTVVMILSMVMLSYSLKLNLKSFKTKSVKDSKLSLVEENKQEDTALLEKSGYCRRNYWRKSRNASCRRCPKGKISTGSGRCYDPNDP